MTNHHVIEKGIQITVTFPEGDTYNGKVVVSDDAIDIAILQIEPKDSYPTLPFSETWEEDMPVYVIGNPLFFNHIANKGEIRGLTSVSNREKQMLILDAPIYRGNSGSPVINEAGEVIAVVYGTKKIVDGDNQKRVGLAIPVDYFRDYLIELSH